MIFPLLLVSAQSAAADPAPPDILITASRVPEDIESTAASVSVIDDGRLERTGEPLAPAQIRLTPSAAVETGGPAGSLAQVRIRGAEANHTLLFIDGVRANDPAAGDIPRFELLNADIISRIEVVRGPQSALWGSDAIGGVVAINGVAPDTSRYSAIGEGGSFGFGRAGASAALVAGKGSLSAAAGWQRATGIDSFGGGGDRDGYRNFALRARASWSVAPDVELGASGFSLAARNEFDGFNLAPPFQRTDTLDSSRNRLSAGRLWVSAGKQEAGLSGTVTTSFLSSRNRNLLDEEEINRTWGSRWNVNGQIQYRFPTGAVSHLAVLAVENERERFHARDSIYGGGSNQDRSRSRQSVTAEWRAELSSFVADIAVRHDRFSAFTDATTLRASALVRLGGGFSGAASYSEGIAQPTFFDLYGFFPGTFAGNPDLRPESSRGFELSLRYRQGRLDAALTGYRQRLRDEIVDVFDLETFQSSAVNRDQSSKRSGVEVELGWSATEALRISANYSYLAAEEPGASAGLLLREIRRPKHRAAIAADGQVGRFTYGASLAYVGSRVDLNVDVFPAQRVRLDPYLLAGARVAHRLRPGVEVFARASNLLGEGYEDVFGYRTEGRALYAGIRLGAR